MKQLTRYILIFIAFAVVSFGQGFDTNSDGTETFYFKDEMGRNQAVFFSEAPLESITGMSSEVDGEVTIDLNNLSSVSGEIVIPSSSLKSGIEMRDEHIRSANWLDSENNPEISFELKDIKNVQKVNKNVMKAEVVGEFTVKGVTKEITTDATLTYLEESEATKARVKRGGDLLGVKADFNINLSDYSVKNDLIGSKVAEEIEIRVNIIGSNVKPE